MLPDNTNPVDPKLDAVKLAFSKLPDTIREYSLGVQDILIADLLRTAADRVRLDISSEGVARSARDGLKATIAALAHERGNTEMYAAICKSMIKDQQLDVGAVIKEKAR